jgi:hypothetical protein
MRCRRAAGFRQDWGSGQSRQPGIDPATGKGEREGVSTWRWGRVAQLTLLGLVAVVAPVLPPAGAGGGTPGNVAEAGPLADDAAAIVLPQGMYFPQAGGSAERGFDLRDYQEPAFGRAAFWSAFQQLGGPDTLGPPISRPFTTADGCVYQLTQAAMLQQCAGQDVQLANTFEIFQEAGLDAQLYRQWQVPLPIADDGSAGYAQAVRTRLGWLTNPEIRAYYLGAPGAAGWTDADAIARYGLPMSRPEDFGPFVAQRFQRIVLQAWQRDVPGMPPPGSVVAVLGGDLLKETRLVAGPAVQPHAPGDSLRFDAPVSLGAWTAVQTSAGPAPATALATPGIVATRVAALAPGAALTPAPQASPASAAATLTATPRGQPLQYGFQGDLMAPPARAKAIAMTKEAGFGWLKQQVIWSQYERTPGVYDPERVRWIDDVVNEVNGAGLKLLLSVTQAPRFYTAAGGGGLLGRQPSQLPLHFERFLQFLANRYRGKVQAYQTWNEPNMIVEWGMGPLWPDGPRDFVQLQKRAYAGVKAGDPAALVVFPAMTPTGVGECETCDRSFAIDERVYLDLVYRVNGGEIKRYFDVLGAHPYGYNNPPGDWTDRATVSSPGYKGHPSFYFRRFTQLREVMLAHGDDKPIWLSEFGWSACARPVPAYDYCRDNSEVDQARYLTEAFAMLRGSYPYITHAFVWNLNFQMVVPEQDQMWGFGVLRPDGSPRPAYTALKTMPK